MAENEFSNVKIEKVILKHLIQNKRFCQNTFMFTRVVDGHFTKLFHVDALSTIKSYYEKYGFPPPDIDKFKNELEKNITHRYI